MSGPQAMVERGGSDMEVREITLTEGLVSERKKIEQRLEEINAAIAAIESQPGVQQVLDALSKIGRLRNY